MSEARARDVKVFKSLAKEDTYVYLPVEDEYDDLPEAFRRSFGQTGFVVEFHLSRERTLAQADAAVVLRAIDEQGFYVQLPPPPAHLKNADDR